MHESKVERLCEEDPLSDGTTFESHDFLNE